MLMIIMWMYQKLLLKNGLNNSSVKYTIPTQYKEEYTTYLKSTEWKTLRKLVLKRDKYRCVDCNVVALSSWNTDGEKLQVHHIHYDGIDTMTFTAEQCVSVCSNCHSIRHGR